MTATTLSFAPATARAPRVGTARIDHWFKPAKSAPQPRAAERTATAEIGTARVEHWFRDQARAGQWSAQVAGGLAAPVDRGVAPQAPRLSGLRAWWLALRQRRALAKAEAELRALAMNDPRVLRELQVAQDRAEWQND